MKKKQMKDTQAAREDAEEEEQEQQIPKAGESLLSTYKTQQACQMLIQTILRERAESKQKDEIIKRKDEEISWMRAENFALRKAAATYLHETYGTGGWKNAPAPPAIPEILDTPQARSLLRKLTEGQILDEHWQPLGLSNAEKGIVAQYLSGRLNIAAQWQTFGSLWNMKPETLRRAASKALDQRKTLDFQERLKSLLRA